MSGDHPSHGGRSHRERRRGHGWVVTVDVVGIGDQDLADRARELRDLLEPYAGDVTLHHDLCRFGATFSIGEPNLDAASALSYGSEIFRDLATRAGLPFWPIVHAEVTQVVDHPTLRIVH
jgi:hypothetical protein